MAPMIYPEPTWSNRFGRVVRTLQVVAIAGAIGAVGGGVAVVALVGGSSPPRHSTALVVGASNQVKSVAPPAAQASPQQSVAAAEPSSNGAATEQHPDQQAAAAEPSSNSAATGQHPDQQAATPADSSADTHVYNRVEPEKKEVQAPPPRSRAKATRRTLARNAERARRERGAPYATDNGRYSDARGTPSPYPADRGRYSDNWSGPYSGEHYSSRNYDPPRVTRGYYFGGGGFYDRGGWGN